MYVEFRQVERSVYRVDVVPEKGNLREESYSPLGMKRCYKKG